MRTSFKRKLEDIDFVEVEMMQGETLLELIHRSLKRSKSEIRELFKNGAVSGMEKRFLILISSPKRIYFQRLVNYIILKLNKYEF